MAAREAEAIPLPKEDTTPPVIKINLVIRARFDRFGDRTLNGSTSYQMERFYSITLHKFKPVPVYRAPRPAPPLAAAPDTARTPINPPPLPILRPHTATA